MDSLSWLPGSNLQDFVLTHASLSNVELWQLFDLLPVSLHHFGLTVRLPCNRTIPLCLSAGIPCPLTTTSIISLTLDVLNLKDG